MSTTPLSSLTIHLPVNLHKELKIAAVKCDENIRSLVIEAIEEKLDSLKSDQLKVSPEEHNFIFVKLRESSNRKELYAHIMKEYSITNIHELKASCFESVREYLENNSKEEIHGTE